MPQAIDTIGHSSRSWPDFLGILRAWHVQRIIDVRSHPGSRAHPHFNQDPLRASLDAVGIGYSHVLSLGGRRGKRPGTDPAENAGWEHPAFHNFADYARSPAFLAAVDELSPHAAAERCAIMCSEAVWWRCHRRIITDYLLVRGWGVRHIMSLSAATPATLTPFARPAADGTIAYPALPGLFADPMDSAPSG